jgi:hydrogenase/urease accessory protein HupE
VDFLVLGLEHIITGYDHLAFLLGLLLVVGAVRQQRGGLWPALRYLLAIVTSFTVAHSVTLVATALGWLSVPSKLVEPAIALSIVYVGVENLVVSVPRRRWLLTFAFGLVHGFGFAHMLRDIGLPHNGLVLSLAAFNLGVELGQVAVVAVCVLLLALAMTRIPQRWYRAVVVRGGSVAVALLGLLWLAERVFGVSLLPL